MSTSLARQLGSLASEGGERGLQRASLMFTQREAASFDLDDIFELGTNGLLELAQNNSHFSHFRTSLLSPQARRMDRDSLAADAVQALDKELRSLLQLLSPVFLLRAAHKVLEWLLWRFAVHRHNVADVVACCLPFHDTVIAARLIQLLAVDRMSIFSFLEGVRRSGAPMPRSFLVDRCVASPALLTFVHDRAMAAAADGVNNRALTSLWAALAVGVVRERAGEETTRSVLPQAVAAGASPDPFMRAAAVMALLQLCGSVLLEPDALDLVLSTFSRSLLARSNGGQQATEEDANMTMAFCLLCQTQRAEQLKFSVKLLTHFIVRPELLKEASAACNADAFLVCLLSNLALLEFDEHQQNRVAVAIWEPALAAADIPRLLSEEGGRDLGKRVLLHCAEKQQQNAVAPEVWKRLSKLLNACGTNCGLGIQEALASAKDAPTRAMMEECAVKLFGATSSHSPLPGTGTTVLLGLTHREEAVRLLSVAAVDREVRGGHLNGEHPLVRGVCALSTDPSARVREAVFSCDWIVNFEHGDDLYAVVEPCLKATEQPQVITRALRLALRGGLPQAITHAVGLCLVPSGSEGSAELTPWWAILEACHDAKTRNHKSSLVQALGGLWVGNAAAAADGEDVDHSKAKKKHKKKRDSASSHVVPSAGTEQAKFHITQQTASAESVLDALVHGTVSDFASSWKHVSSLSGAVYFRFVHALLTRETAKFDDDSLAQIRTSTIEKVNALDAFPREVVFDKEQAEAWESRDDAIALAVSAMVRRCAPRSEQEFEGLFEFLSRFKEDSVSPLFQTLLSRGVEQGYASSPLELLANIFSNEHLSALARLRALHVAEAALEHPEVAKHAPRLLSSLLVPLQYRKSSRLRKAALRCIARLAKLEKKTGKSAVASIVLRLNDRSAEIRQAAAAIETAFRDLPAKAVLQWAVQVVEECADRPDGAARGRRVAVLRAVRLVSSAERVSMFRHHLKAALEDGGGDDSASVEVAALLLEGLAGCGATVAKDGESVSLVVSALRHGADHVVLAALSAVTVGLWHDLDKGGRRLIVEGLSVALASGKHDIVTKAGGVARGIGMANGTTDILAAELRLRVKGRLLLDAGDGTAADQDEENEDDEEDKSRRRKKGAASAGGGGRGGSAKRAKAASVEDVNAELRRLDVLLELIRSSEVSDQTIVAALVALLDDLAAYVGKVAAVDFTMQQVLACLNLAVDRAKVTVADKDVSVLLRCLYVNLAPHWRNAVLSVLVSIAAHDAMPIARQIMMLFANAKATASTLDNKASFRLMNVLLERVLPHLPSAKVGEVLNTFLDALPSLPKHRREILLQCAASSLPGNPFGSVLAGVLRADKRDGMTREDCVELALALCNHVGPLATVSGLAKLIAVDASNVQMHFVASALTAEAFSSAYLKLAAEEEDEVQEALGGLFQVLLEHCAGGFGATAEGSAFYKAFDAINELFTVAHFVSGVHALLAHASLDIRGHAATLLNQRAKTLMDSTDLRSDDVIAFAGLLPVLCGLLGEDAKLSEVVLLAIGVVGRLCASSQPDATTAALLKVLDFARGLLAAKGTPLLAEAALVVSGISGKLGATVLPNLDTVVQFFVNALQRCAQATSVANAKATVSENVAFFVLSAVLELVVCVGAFLGPHAVRLLRATLLPHWLARPKLASRIEEICNAFAESLAPRQLAQALHEVVASDSASVAAYIVRAASVASNHTSRPSDLKQLWNVCISAAQPSAARAFSSELVEAAASSAAEVAFHMSESEFRPLFVALVETASNHAGQSSWCGPVLSIGVALLERLELLAVPWCSKLADDAAKVLASASSALQAASGEDAEAQDGAALAEALQVELHAALWGLQFIDGLTRRDSDGSVGRDAQALMIDPVVNCLRISRLREATPQALVSLATVMNSETMWRPLNTSMLHLLRVDDSSTRLATLQTMKLLWKKFGEEWLPLLPETVPFLGELMEDDTDAVVRAAQDLIQFINSFLPPEANILQNL